MNMEKYNPQEIEPKWQKEWEKQELYKTPEDVSKEDKMYILPQLPYPSGSGLHVGHAEVYTACDIFARYQRMTGKKVLQVIGWDSFGLPAENYAIKTNVHPKIKIAEAVDNFRSQIKSLGISVDWDREVGSHTPEYYKWTQWFFLLFYKRGLAYRKMQSVNWCDSCKTVLANEQVVTTVTYDEGKVVDREQGRCERCDTYIIQRDMEQWFLKITQYADRLLEGLDKIDWPEETKKRQRDWIGRSQGALVCFNVVGVQNVQIEQTKRLNKRSDQTIATIKVFTTRPDTLFGATYMVLAPENRMIEDLRLKITNWEAVEKYIKKSTQKTELERQSEKEKTGVELQGVKAVNPVNGEEIPIWVADYVLASYGTGAIMAVPAHDERDFAFAKKFDLPIRQVVSADGENQSTDKPFIEEGKAINSDFLNNFSTKEAKEKMITWLEENNVGERKVQYRLRDWSVSRQRFWGAPIPMLYDEKGELQPVPEHDLPVLLPDDVDFKPTGQSPLTYSENFQKGVEEKYGKGWKREVDTLDTFMCSSWYYYRYLDPKNDAAFASPEALKKWMPVDFYLGGEEHVNGHLLYSRFFTKVLFDAGYIDFDEPFTKHRHQGLILGPDHRKMSKRWDNVVNPTDVVNEYGADTLRMYEMFMGPLEQTKPWDTNGVKGIRRFLDKVWNLNIRIANDTNIRNTNLGHTLHKTIKKVTEDLDELKFNTAIAKLMELVNEMSKQKGIAKESFEIFLKLLAPFAPHMAEELWHELGRDSSITVEDWPKYDESKIVEDAVTLAVQVNGKLRATVEASVDISEDDAKALALEQSNVQKWLEGKEPKKVIYVKGKLVSIVV
jgi:leucyl-tRNA synthetase